MAQHRPDYQGLLETCLALPFWRFKPYSVLSLIFCKRESCKQQPCSLQGSGLQTKPYSFNNHGRDVKRNSLFTEWCFHRIIILGKNTSKYFSLHGTGCLFVCFHILGSFGLDLNIMAEVSASWNIIVTGWNTLNMWVRL